MPDLSLRSDAADRAGEHRRELERGFTAPQMIVKASAGVLHPRVAWACIECQGDGIKPRYGKSVGTKSVPLGSTAAAARGVFIRPALPGAMRVRPEEDPQACGPMRSLKRVVPSQLPGPRSGICALSRSRVDRCSDRIANRLSPCPVQVGGRS